MIQVTSFDTMQSAAAALSEESHYLAGGTILMRQVNYANPAIKELIRLTSPASREIENDGSRLRIGAGATMADIIANRDMRFLHPVARSIGGPAIQNMATLGGNLYAHSPHGDLATALLALDATLLWSDGREEPVEAFFARRTSTRGIIDSVTFQRPPDGQFRYLKVSRAKREGASVLTIACNLPRSAGRLGEVRVAFGSMGPTPLRAKSVEAALKGSTLDENGIKQALGVVCAELVPIDDALSSAWYRVEVAPIHLRRLLLEREAR